MSEHLHHRVRISLSRGQVVLPWDSRQALLGQMRHLDSAVPIIAAFEAVGVSRPVQLTIGDMNILIEVIE